MGTLRVERNNQPEQAPWPEDIAIVKVSATLKPEQIASVLANMEGKRLLHTVEWLSHAFTGPQLAAYCSTLASLPSLTSISEVSTPTLRMLFGQATLTRLHRLCIHDPQQPPTVADVVRLVQALQAGNIELLHVTRTKLPLQPLVDGLREHSWAYTLTTLMLDECSLGSAKENVGLLSQLLQHYPTLESLYVADHTLVPGDVGQLASASMGTSLQSLTFANMEVDTTDVSALLMLLDSNHLLGTLGFLPTDMRTVDVNEFANVVARNQTLHTLRIPPWLLLNAQMKQACAVNSALHCIWFTPIISVATNVLYNIVLTRLKNATNLAASVDLYLNARPAFQHGPIPWFQLKTLQYCSVSDSDVRLKREVVHRRLLNGTVSD